MAHSPRTASNDSMSCLISRANGREWIVSQNVGFAYTAKLILSRGTHRRNPKC